MKIVYAGLLGVAQNVLGIIEHIDFAKFGTELHIYGNGNQQTAIEKFIATHYTGIFFHGSVSKSEMTAILIQYDAALVPLSTDIRGAVPSKLFELMPLGIPVLFCGSGEGADIVRNHRIGLVCKPANYKALEDNIKILRNMTKEECNVMAENGRNAANNLFNFDWQIKQCYDFIKNICNNEKTY